MAQFRNNAHTGIIIRNISIWDIIKTLIYGGMINSYTVSMSNLDFY